MVYSGRSPPTPASHLPAIPWLLWVVWEAADTRNNACAALHCSILFPRLDASC